MIHVAGKGIMRITEDFPEQGCKSEVTTQFSRFSSVERRVAICSAALATASLKSWPPPRLAKAATATSRDG
jgi:hypothetical protein